jgi:outer membrane receptor for Fe3+-dicitrate
MGEHELKFGYEWSQGKAVEWWEWDYIMVVDGEFAWRQTNSPDYYYDSLVYAHTFYVTDSWSVNDRLHMNLGLRYENQRANNPDSDTPEGINVKGYGDIHTFNNLAPRFGFTYKIDKNGSLLLRGSVGRYYEQMTTGQLDRFCSNPSYLYTYYWDGSDWVVWDYWPESTDLDYYALDDNLSQTYTDAVTFGVEYDMGNGIALGADYIYRETKNFISLWQDGYTWTPVSIEFDGTTYNVFSQSGGSYHMTIKNSDDDLYANFSGLVLRATKRYSDNWQLQTSLTISETKGTAESMSGSTRGQTLGGFDYYENPNNQINRDGYLWAHRPINLKVNGTYTFPWDISLSAIAEYVSGMPWTPLVYLESDDLNQGYVEIMAEPRGSRRLDSIFKIDTRLEKTFSWDKYKAQFILDIYNIFNSGTYNAIHNWLDLPSFGTYRSVVQGRRYQFGIRLSF